MASFIRTATHIAAVLATCTALLPAAPINNGSFESGLTGWTVVDLTDPLDPPGTNTFFLQSGMLSPVNLLTVPAPPDGTNAAMSDAAAPGSHVLYQDIVIPTSVLPTTLAFSLYINNLADDFFIPSPTNTLNFATTARNQQARVDIISASADPFTVETTDVLMMLFLTQPGDSLVSGYANHSADVTSLFQTFAGQTVRLRFATVNNVGIMNVGVDSVSLTESAIPEPATGFLFGAGVFSWILFRNRHRAR